MKIKKLCKGKECMMCYNCNTVICNADKRGNFVGLNIEFYVNYSNYTHDLSVASYTFSKINLESRLWKVLNE